MSRLSILAPAAGLTVLLAADAGADGLAHADALGRIRALDVGGELVEVTTDLRLHHPGWSGLSSLATWSAELSSFRETMDEREWRGRIPVRGSFCAYEQVLREDGGSVRLDVRLAPESDLPLEAIHFHLAVPVHDYEGGRVVIRGGEADTAGLCPSAAPTGSAHFLSSVGTQAVFTSASGRRTLSVNFDEPRAITVQDERLWASPSYGLFVTLADSGLRAGEEPRLGVTLRAGGSPDRTPVRIELDPSRRLFRFDGLGGNYCFALDSPVTAHTLADAPSRWARLEMKLRDWAPRALAAADAAGWRACATNDTAGSDLRRSLEVGQTLQERGVPTMISVWRLPEWLYAWPGYATEGPRTVAAERWPELLAAVGSYLIYAKELYGVEPVLFSFNESDIGVDVKLTAAEHVEMVRRLGAHLRSLGLRTRLAAGDTGSARGDAVEYAAAPLRDAEARRHVGAIAFHSWGGASAEEYAAWAALARRYRLPLLAAEIGYDSAWRSVRAWYNTPLYAMAELRVIQDLLAHAQITGGMYWEFTGDYAPVTVRAAPVAGETGFEPTQRYAQFRQFTALTPPQAQALAVRSSHEQVLVTAFEGRQAGRRVYALHIANLGAEREAAITGLPRSVKELRAVSTTDRDRGKEWGSVRVLDGEARVTLPGQCLMTLASQPIY